MTDCSGINADEQQLIKLCLKKPKKWHWELTTSKSSSNIAFPTIQLFDDDNTTLLVQANEANFTAGSKHYSTTMKSKRSDSSKSIRSPITIVELPDETQMPSHDLKTSFSTADCKASSSSFHHRRSSSSVRSKASILKRIREFSEMAYEDESSEDERAIRNEIISRFDDRKYSMRTCNIGTIIVPKESFSSSTLPRRRRRMRDSDDFDNVKTALPHSPRIIDVQDINSKITIETPKYLRRDVSASSPSSDEVFLLLVKRLQALHHNNSKAYNLNANEKQRQQTILSEKFDKSVTLENYNRLNETISSSNNNSTQYISEQSMGSNVTTAKGGLSGRRTQSQSNIDNKSSINNNGGICCSTKYSTKSKRKNSNLSQQDFDKKSAFSNNNNNNEHFDGIAQIIAGTDHQMTLKPKKNASSSSSQGGGKASTKDKQKLHGSLPNHLDTDVDGYEGSDDTNSSTYGNRVKFSTTVSKIIPTPNSPSSHTIDQCYDQGYGSERSPEDEVLPPLPLTEQHYGTMVVNSLPQGLMHGVVVNNGSQMFVEMDYGGQKFQQQQHYDFITEDCTFNVEIVKGPGGLGLSVSGGIEDTSAPYPGLIRIKRLFPHQAAWLTGQLQPGDILLEANGIILTGLTNNEALEVLRTMANVVNLLVCRPHDENFRKLSPPSIEAPIPPLRLRSSFNFKTHQEQFMNQLETPPGEFEITLIKQQGSLGFTLQKEDDSVVGHYVRALVRAPATTDGRIRPGDRIIAVNDIPITDMTHEEAVIFLRQSPDTVKLRLHRHHGELNSMDMVDNSSITGTLKRSKLRPEAMTLISDLATRKNTQSTTSSDGNSGNSSFQSTTNTLSSPRRLRKNGGKTQHDSTDSTLAGVSFDLSSNSILCMNQSFASEGGGTTSSSGTHTPFSDSSADTLTVVSQQKYYDPNELPADDDDIDNINDGFYDSDELENLEHDNNCSKANRPEYLNLASSVNGQADSGSTPLVSRKPMYKFSIATANAYELNNLDNVDLDAPTSYRLNNSDGIDEIDGDHTFTSLPCETLLLACKTEHDLKRDSNNDVEECLYVTKKFGKNQPLYQSAQVQINHKQRQHDDMNVVGEMANLLKWKGVTMMSPTPPPQQQPSTLMNNDDYEDDKCSIISSSTAELPPPITSLRVSIRNAQKDINLDEMGIDSNTHKIITIEMNRRWSCRLGIRLESQLSENIEGKTITVIKEICKDTLAEKDGRLKAGDRVLMINDEIVDSRSTQEIIDMMRIIRGPLCITIARKNQPIINE